jgi:hypothetical protein
VPQTVVQMVDDFLDRYVRYGDLPGTLTTQCKDFLEGEQAAQGYAQAYVLKSVIAERELAPALSRREGTASAVRARETAFLRAVAEPLLVGFTRKAQPRAALGARAAAILQDLPFLPDETIRKQLGRVVRTTFDAKQQFPWSRRLRQEVAPPAPKEGELVDLYDSDWTATDKMDGHDPRTWDLLEACRMELVGAREEGSIPRLAKAIHDAEAAKQRLVMSFPTLDDEVTLSKSRLCRIVIDKEMAARSVDAQPSSNSSSPASASPET